MSSGPAVRVANPAFGPFGAMFHVGDTRLTSNSDNFPLKRSVFGVFFYVGGLGGQKKGGGVREAFLEHSVPRSEPFSEAHETTCFVG